MKLKTLAVTMIVTLASGVAYAQSSKATARVAEVQLMDWSSQQESLVSDGWSTLMDTSLKVSGKGKDLLVGVSLETGLMTRTLVRSKKGEADESAATAGIEIRVIIDGDLQNPVAPGIVMYDKRQQVLTAKFGGILEECTDLDGDGTILVDEECLVTEEELELMLSTMGARHFNFIAPNVGVGEHTITVHSRITLDTRYQLGDAEAKAMIGKGTITVEEARFVNGNGIEM